jgi:hypothetical protein
MTSVDAEASLIELAVEGWRFARVFARALGKLDAGEANRYANQLRYFCRKIEASLVPYGLVLVNIEGHKFDTGMAVSAVNLGDFESADDLVVEQMIEPIIMGQNGLRKPGVVLLRKEHA